MYIGSENHALVHATAQQLSADERCLRKLYAAKIYGSEAHAQARKQRVYQLRKRAKAMGHVGAQGGWIYSVRTGAPICQGWDEFVRRMPQMMRLMIVGSAS